MPKKVLTYVALGIGSATLVGCANYSGEGNEFVVEGTVLDAGDESLKIDITNIVDTHGQADGWFTVGDESRIHDNCDCHGTWRGRKTYGEVIDMDGIVIEPNDVLEGACVAIQGKIRSNSEGKTTTERPVFDIAVVIPCE